MPIESLSYLGVRSDRIDDWRYFASKILAMQLDDQGGRQLSFRMDDLAQRLVVSDEPGETLAFIGWEVTEKSDLDAYAARLENAGHQVTPGDPELANRRFVEDLIVFHDPAGNRIELVWNPKKSDTPFVPGRPIDGFKTGPLGMGHAVLHVPDATALLPFYRDVLGFAVSDYGLKPIPLYFFHVNGRHHSFAIVGSGNRGFHHFMVEYQNLDDMGQGYDLACQGENGIAYTLGRHTNDYMTSFYANSPSGFFVENGWGGRVIDPETWQPHETTCGPSFWGHDRLYLPEADRKAFVDMRLKASQEGLRAPPIVECPWLYETLRQNG
ncbi:VOC family protein [uncultured Shimia sp.]|uniref:VOC family protein n=1 Tax=uncultured Shimia sp. TaxID=573152 RepID=UPI00261F4E15|nr:VOC family protein [uncultured Shimia sp.]